MTEKQILRIIRAGHEGRQFIRMVKTTPARAKEEMSDGVTSIERVSGQYALELT